MSTGSQTSRCSSTGLVCLEDVLVISFWSVNFMQVYHHYGCYSKVFSFIYMIVMLYHQAHNLVMPGPAPYSSFWSQISLLIACWKYNQDTWKWRLCNNLTRSMRLCISLFSSFCFRLVQWLEKSLEGPLGLLFTLLGLRYSLVSYLW